MKFSLSITFGAAALAAVLLAGIAESRAADPRVERLEEGRKKFEATCSECHGLDRPLSRDMTPAEWDILLLDMAEKGARFGPDDKATILEYLGARAVFAVKCTVCHEKEKVFNREKTLAEWQATVGKMAEKKPEFFSREEAEIITAYLTLVLGSPPAHQGR
jgi:mono/diheme cytochrome c family protein